MIHYSEFEWAKVNKDTYYSNRYHKRVYKFIMTMDTETTSCFYSDGEWKQFDYSWNDDYLHGIQHGTLTYIWMVSIDANVYYGRTVKELRIFMDTLNECFEYPAMCYVHNLAYDFQMTRGEVPYTNVFARKERKPIKCEYGNTEFRCSYFLTQMSLARAGERFTKLKKLKGELDYEKVRAPHTKLTRREKLYCEYDCLVLQQVILAYAKKYGGVFEIPLTQTGEVREVLKSIVKGHVKYHELCRKLTPSTIVYKKLKFVFSGGDTHANPLHEGIVKSNIKSNDFSSAHPSHFLFDKYPMTSFVKVRSTVSLAKLKEAYPFEQYAIIADLRYKNIESKDGCHSYFSGHKCKNLVNEIYDNGRIYSADSLDITLTEIDIMIAEMVYDIGDVDFIGDVYVSKKEYLPKELIDLTLAFYVPKTQLKGVKGHEDYYLNSKQMLNGIYGMCATDILSAEVSYSNSWHVDKLTDDIIAEKLERMRNSRNTRLAYQWGVWTPLYTRLYLWQCITKIGKDEIYHDTDCIHYEGDYDWVFEEFNAMILDKLVKAEDYFNVPRGTFSPQDARGNAHPIGIFESEPSQEKFVSLGAKKYAVVSGGKLNITVSGVNKKSALDTSLEGTALTRIEDFKDGWVFDKRHSGRKVREYIDEPVTMIIDGIEYVQNTGFCLYPTTYTLGVTNEYDELCQYVQNAMHEVI